jgi:GT2 family glycosyltransferase
VISYVMPTRDRAERLKATLERLATLEPHEAEVIVVDNASSETPILPRTLTNGLVVRHLKRETNEGAAARNHGALHADPASAWIVMLDDDSYPTDTAFIESLHAAPADVAAISADIHLCDRQGRPAQRESGGLPEVFIGCGVALRREAFLSLGGYDSAFNYYAEEYDLAARFLLSGMRVVFDHDFSVIHAKDSRGRDMNTILGRLVRNNGWVAQRYAPHEQRLSELREARSRYRRIALKEHAVAGFGRGLSELRRTLRSQRRTPMSDPLWDRFTGLAQARATLQEAWSQRPFRNAAIVDEGKNAWVVSRALSELGVRLSGEGEEAETLVIGTMSPGPMLDAWERRSHVRFPAGRRVLMPWIPGAAETVPAGAKTIKTPSRAAAA